MDKYIFYLLVISGVLTPMTIDQVQKWLPKPKPTWDETYTKDPTDPRRLPNGEAR